MMGADYSTSRRKVLVVANGYPSQERPWKCPFNHRAVKAIVPFWKPSVVSMRAWLPWRRAQTFAYDGIRVREVLVPHFPNIPSLCSDQRSVGGLGLQKIVAAVSISSITNQIRKSADGIDLIHSIASGRHALAAQQVADDIGVPHIVQLIGGDVTTLDVNFAQSDIFQKWVHKVSFFIANSKSLQTTFEKKTALSIPIATIYRGVDPSVFTPDLEKKGNYASNTCQFLYLGGHIHRSFYREGSDTKGADLLLRAWQIMEKEVSKEAKLVLGGPMIDVRGIKRFLQSLRYPERVIFIGSLAAEEVPDVIRRSDVLVIPSRKEGLPNVCLEAMACGVSVVATAVGGLPEIIKSGFNGVLVPSGDVNALAAAMINLLQNPAMIVQLGVKARKDIIEQFDSRSYGLKLSNIYNLTSRCF